MKINIMIDIVDPDFAPIHLANIQKDIELPNICKFELPDRRILRIAIKESNNG